MFVRLLLCALFLLASVAGAAPTFSTTFLPTNTFAYSINQSGHFAGESDFPSGVRHAALWNRQGGPFDLGSLGEFSTAQAISNNGLVAGYSVLADGFTHGFLYSGAGLRDIGTLAGGGNSFAYGVNSAGTVVGEADDASGEFRPVAFSNGVLRDLSPGGVAFGQARAINDAGLIAGGGRLVGADYAHALLFDGDTVRDLGTLGGPASFGFAINDLGQVAGTSFINDDIEHMFLYSEGVMQDIGSLGGPSTGTRALNNLGNVVGYSTYPDDQPGVSFSKATLYQDGVVYDLNTLADTDNGFWILTDAVAINDAQQILVNACTEFGDCRTALLTAVPEPGSLVLLLAGLLALGAGRWAVPRSVLFR
ncbi:PEP-CTERM sorting domain-containing protein [Massilia sp. S19_KUP03_FR1]|uniref:PEP-CTERM sorting domain-containing protein n=1 Tax=Massilia sp. S19_KUP03_FR1 TaxID=3025503 RepID=UPI002FCD8052